SFAAQPRDVMAHSRNAAARHARRQPVDGRAHRLRERTIGEPFVPNLRLNLTFPGILSRTVSRNAERRPLPRLSVKGYVTSTFFPGCAQAASTDRCRRESRDVCLRNGPCNVRG